VQTAQQKMEAPFETVKESPSHADILKEIEAEMQKSTNNSSSTTKDYYKLFVRKRNIRANKSKT
jgi:hypothetical protein